MNRSIFSRAALIGAFFVVIALFLVGFLPLFDGPGYEHALAAGLIVPSVAAIVSASDVFRDRSRTPFESAVYGLSVGAFFAACALAMAWVHAFRVGFCDPVGGSLFFALTAGAGSCLGGLWGALVGEGARRVSAPRWVAIVCAIAAPASGIVVSFARYYASPMVFAFDPFFGYFGGVLYDTVIDAGDALWVYRAASLVTCLGVLLVLAKRFALGVVLIAISVAIAICGPRFGHWHTASTLRAALGGQLSGARCDIVFPAGVLRADAELMLRDCEEELASVENAFGVRGPQRITAYFFRDAAEKKRLMGAGDTYIAKPWRDEVYLQLASYPHPILGHEIAHVVAGAFGRGPFRVAGSLGGLVPDPGLIEGAAVAASPGDDDLSEVEWSRAMLQLGILPHADEVFSLRFLAAPAARSYTVAGAFINWFKGAYGAEAFRKWYGGASVEQVSGRSAAAIDVEFRHFLAEKRVSDGVLAYAKARFERPGLFARRCPHVVDALRQRGDQCRDKRDYARAIEYYDDALSYDAGDHAARFGRSAAMIRSAVEARDGAFGAQAMRNLEAVAGEPKAPRTWRDRSDQELADTQFREGNFEPAESRYRALASRLTDEDAARTNEVKELVASGKSLDLQEREAARALLVGERDRPTDIFVAAAKLGASRGPLSSFLLGKSFVQRGFYADGLKYLREAAKSPPTERIAREVLRQRAIAACALNDQTELDAVRAQLEVGAPSARLEWISRLVDRCAR